MKHSRRPICVRRSAARRARQGALHNRRGAGLRERVRAAAYAVCRRRFAVRRRGFAERKDVLTVCRGFRGFRKVVLRALTPARPVWRAPFPARSATGNIANPARCAGVGKCVLRARRCGEIAKKDSPLVTGGGIFARPAAAPLLRSLWAASLIGRKAHLRPDSPLGCRCGKPAKKRFSAVRGPLRDGCGRLTEVYGIRAPAADMVCGAL